MIKQIGEWMVDRFGTKELPEKDKWQVRYIGLRSEINAVERRLKREEERCMRLTARIMSEGQSCEFCLHRVVCKVREGVRIEGMQVNEGVDAIIGRFCAHYVDGRKDDEGEEVRGVRADRQC